LMITVMASIQPGSPADTTIAGMVKEHFLNQI